MRRTTKGPYALAKEDHLTALHFVRGYYCYKEQIRSIVHKFTTKPMSLVDFGELPEEALNAITVPLSKVQLINQAAEAADESLAEYLIRGVAKMEPYEALSLKGIPHGRDYYFEKRKKFLFLVAHDLNFCVSHINSQKQY